MNESELNKQVFAECRKRGLDPEKNDMNDWFCETNFEKVKAEFKKTANTAK